MLLEKREHNKRSSCRDWQITRRKWYNRYLLDPGEASKLSALLCSLAAGKSVDEDSRGAMVMEFGQRYADLSKRGTVDEILKQKQDCILKE